MPTPVRMTMGKKSKEWKLLPAKLWKDPVHVTTCAHVVPCSWSAGLYVCELDNEPANIDAGICCSL